MNHRVLIVDDESTVRFAIRKFLARRGFDVEEADSCLKAEELFLTSSPDIVILDYSLLDGSGLDLMSKLKSIDPQVPFIILTAHGSIDLAVKAIKDGAEQFLTKPVPLETLLVVLNRLQERRRDTRKQIATSLRQHRGMVDPFPGSSAAICRLKEMAGKIAATDHPVLIQGETGTGKSVLARWLHLNGPRSEEAMVELNSAGLTREFLETELFGHEKGAFTGAATAKQGLMEVAHRGSLFLDEIGDMDLSVQPKLLKAIEEKTFRRLGDVRDRKVDIRLIAATHQDLKSLVREKKFREDLYFRINTIPLVIPPLRDRKEDIPAIAQFLLDSITSEIRHEELTFSDDAITALQSYSWPGNIRELRSVLDRAALLSEKSILRQEDIFFETISQKDDEMGGATMTLDEVERSYIERILRMEKGLVESAAQRLRIPRSSLYYKIKKHGIKLP